jgi:hypothetical protein
MTERRSGLRSRKLKIALALGLIVLLVPFLWPERARIPDRRRRIELFQSLDKALSSSHLQ